MRENKTINLHDDHLEIAKKLRIENLSMLAYEIETGLSLAGHEFTQVEYDYLIECALSED